MPRVGNWEWSDVLPMPSIAFESHLSASVDWLGPAPCEKCGGRRQPRHLLSVGVAHWWATTPCSVSTRFNLHSVRMSRVHSQHSGDVDETHLGSASETRSRHPAKSTKAFEFQVLQCDCDYSTCHTQSVSYLRPSINSLSAGLVSAVRAQRWGTSGGATMGLLLAAMKGSEAMVSPDLRIAHD